MRPYDPKTIEPKWQKIWENTKLYETKNNPKQPKQYVLAEFPYPSGEGLHTGHPRRYTASDIIARYHRMLGDNVLHPIGWDAFGLPTENFAIKTKQAPQVVTDNNIKTFRKQLKSLGFSFDWSREVNTTDPNYYKWTQWQFLQFYKNNLAYQAEVPVNWCPKCKVGLADEEVVDGKHERCGTVVEKKILKQWLLKITKYADRLVDDLELVDYPEKVKTQQINWIGRSIGALVDFQIEGSKEKVNVFTTRHDTQYGVTFIVLAPEHPLVKSITTSQQKTKVDKYIKSAATKSERDRLEDEKSKTGVFTGAYAINPVNKEKIPIWIADYVLTSYGTGAVMGVPGHDQRDFEFATKFDLPIKFVIEPTFGTAQGDDVQSEKIFVVLRNPKNKTVLVLNWGPRQANFGGNMLIGGSVENGESHRAAAEREIIEETGYTNFKFVKETHFKGHGYFHSNVKNMNVRASGKGLLYDLVDDEQKDTNLDEGEKNKFTYSWQPIQHIAALLDDGIHEAMYRYLALGQCYGGEGLIINSEKYDGMESGLMREQILKDMVKMKVAKEQTNYRMRDWVFSRQRYWGEPIPIIHCSKCGAVPVPEKDLPVVLPEVKEYEPTDTGESPLANVTEWLNVKCPVCGEMSKRETDTMPNWAGSSWYYLRFIDPENFKEFASFEKLKKWLPVDVYIGGMEHTTLHLLYSRFWHKFLYDQKLVPTKEPYLRRRPQGMVLAADGRKMSKSLGNVINPDDIVNSYGADSLRLLEMFMGPNDKDVQWSDRGVVGMRRFLDRVWNLIREYRREHTRASKADNQATLETSLAATTNKIVKSVTIDVEKIEFNTAIASLMELTNDFYKLKEELSFSAAPAFWKESLEIFTKLLAPFAPHICEELWQGLGHKDSVHVQAWPAWDSKLLVEDLITVVVQVNGKVRANLSLPADASEAQMVTAAKADPAVQKYLEKQRLIKTITVPAKLVNFVVN